MINDNRWGILYCPKHEMFGSPKRRWPKIEACLKSNGVEYDFVQSESSAGVDRLIKMMINNGYRTIVVVGGDSALNDAVNCMMQERLTTKSLWQVAYIPRELNYLADYLTKGKEVRFT